VAVVLVALALGVVAGALPAQVHDARQREGLTAVARAEAMYAELRLQLARTAYQEAQRKYDVGVIDRASLALAEADLRVAEGNLALVRLNQEEIRASANPPRNEISAPLVGARDFVSERLQLELASAQARLALVRDSVADLERRVRLGMAERLPLLEAQAELARLEGELQVIAGRLELRREFLDQRLPVAEAERRLQQLELVHEADAVRGLYQVADERLKRLQELRAVGQADALEVKRAELQLLERAAELESVSRQLELLRAARPERR